MSDFDDVLERLVTDPAFAAALAADPAAVLAGYQLEPDEIDLLCSQVSADTGGQTAVEVRANQSSLFGMLSPIVGAVGGLPGIGDSFADATSRPAPEPTAPLPQPGGLAPPGEGIGVPGYREGFGAPSGQGGFGAAYYQGFGPATGPAGAAGAATGGGEAGFGAAPTHGGGAGGPEPVAGFGSAGPGHDVGGTAIGAGFGPPVPGHGASGSAPGGGLAGLGEAIGERVQGGGDSRWLAPPEGYRTDVDMDGDGTDDEYILRGRRDRGVDILVDSNRDGRVDIIGHDDDADGLVESADYDKNRDGTFEKHMYDDNDDGWLDRTVIDRRPSA
ncbi:hypothetical protein [Micromonospora sp. CPCC 206061]|uniref:hypothetical protein n=1 Tax=Micromonospora sp. CPCC 206061 TaxID=3122410 RepID=UPI002FEEA49D